MKTKKHFLTASLQSQIRRFLVRRAYHVKVNVLRAVLQKIALTIEGRAARIVTIILGVFLTVGCAFIHPGISVLLPLDDAGVARDTTGATFASFVIALPTSPDIVERPPATRGSRGFAILAPGSSQADFWHLERVVGLIDDQSSQRRILPPKLNAPPQHVPVAVIYRGVDRKVVIQVDIYGPDSGVRELLGTYACHELAISVKIDSSQAAFFDRLVPLTNTPVGPPCVPRR